MFGSWTGIHHDTDPVAESVPVQNGEDERRTLPPWGYVEPQPEVYARLAALTRLIIEGLEDRLMLSATERDALLELEEWLIFLQEAARRELTGQALSEQEYQSMAQYGILVEKLTRVALGGKSDATDQTLGPEYDEAIIVRVASSEKEYLMEGIGRMAEIYVVVERGRERYLARGGVYSHYEFSWPTLEPLTDVQWRNAVAAGDAPPRPEWVIGFTIPE
jgi:hypothetical protein